MKTLRCPRCTVTHRVQNPLPDRVPNRCRCEVPECGLPYWDACGSTRSGRPNKIIVAVMDENVQQWLDAGCIMEEAENALNN